MDFTGKRVIFLGDSITEGAAADAPEKVFHSILKRLLNLADAINRGVGGTRIARQIKPSIVTSYDEDFNMRYDAMDKNADMLFIFGGTNDYGHGDAELGYMNDTSPYTFCGAFNTLLKKSIVDFGGDNVFVLTPLHRKGEDNLRGEGEKTRDGAPLCRYVEIIKRLAEMSGVHLIDLYSESILNPNVEASEKLFAPDGLHPNNDGHRLLAEIIKNNLEKI